MRKLLSIPVAVVLSVIMMAVWQDGVSQRRVNPVKSASQGLQGKNENRNPADSIDYSKLSRVQDGQGNVILVDTVTGREVPDTASAPAEKLPKMHQPLFYAAAVGVDVWDPVMRAFGQNYGLVEFFGELNLHNRYIPVVEIGFGQTDHTPDDNNYTYKVPVTPYIRIGCNYNFPYNGNTDYMAFAGLRFGWSHFNYEVNDIELSSDYWGESTVFNLPKQTANVTYMQLLFGIRVRVFGPVSLGWCIRYKFKLHESDAAYGLPWYIPGYGSRNGAITGSFAVVYTLPFKKKTVEPEVVE